MAQMANGGSIPTFMNHLESGTFTVESGQNRVEFQLSQIEIPKGILVFSNAFSLYDIDNANKPMLGSYGAVFILGTNALNTEQTSFGSGYDVYRYSCYFTNWASSGLDKYPSFRQSRTETRGIRVLKQNPTAVVIGGFGTGDYDFKYNVQYNWIAWD